MIAKKVSDGKKLAALEIYAKYVSVQYFLKMKKVFFSFEIIPEHKRGNLMRFANLQKSIQRLEELKQRFSATDISHFFSRLPLWLGGVETSKHVLEL